MSKSTLLTAVLALSVTLLIPISVHAANENKADKSKAGNATPASSNDATTSGTANAPAQASISMPPTQSDTSTKDAALIPTIDDRPITVPNVTPRDTTSTPTVPVVASAAKAQSSPAAPAITTEQRNLTDSLSDMLSNIKYVFHKPEADNVYEQTGKFTPQATRMLYSLAGGLGLIGLLFTTNFLEPIRRGFTATYRTINPMSYEDVKKTIFEE